MHIAQQQIGQGNFAPREGSEYELRSWLHGKFSSILNGIVSNADGNAVDICPVIMLDIGSTSDTGIAGWLSPWVPVWASEWLAKVF